MKCFLKISNLVLKIRHAAFMLLLCFLFTACNSDQPELNPIIYAHVDLSTTNIDPTSDRIFIYGTRSDGQEAFARFYTSAPTLELELRKGQWTFYGLAYQTSTINRCAKQTVNLNPANHTLVLDFQNSSCADEVFLGPDSNLNASAFPLVSFPVTTVEFCESVDGITTSTDECSDDLLVPGNRKQPRGHAGSYRYSFHAFEKTRGNYTFTDSIVSTCRSGVPLAPSLRGLASGFMNFDVPAGDTDLAPFYIKLEIFPRNDSCTDGTPHVVTLPHGLRSEVNNVKYVVDTSGTTIHKLYIKSSGDEICTGLNLTSEFANGTGTAIGATTTVPRLICNENQLYNIFPIAGDYNGYANASYKLLKDLDISGRSIGTNFNPLWGGCVTAGTNFAPIGMNAGCTFISPSGVHFDGGGKTIKGMRISRGGTVAGMYYATRGTPANRTQVRRLTLRDPEVSILTYGGAISGDSQNSYYKEITLINPIITTGGSFTGGITGISGADIHEDITIINALITGGQFIGGVTGSGVAQAGVPTVINRAYVDGAINSISVNSTVGGIAGKIGAPGVGILSTISESRFIGSVEGGTQVGGLVGLGVTLRIENSYVRATTIKSRTNGNAMSGGLAGSMTESAASAGIYTSYFYGSFNEACTANDATCTVSTIVGFADGTFPPVSFPSAIFNTSSKIVYSSTNYGQEQANSEFFTLTPLFLNGALDITPLFLNTIWEFRNGDLPRLISEP